MATRRYGLSRGETDFQVTEAVGAATATDDMEFTVDLTKNITKEEAMRTLRMFERWILKGNWPPA